MNVRNTLIVAVALCAMGGVVAAEDRLQVVPLAQYDLVSTSVATVQAPGTGILLLQGNTMALARYALHAVDSDRYHDLEAMVDTRAGHHRFLSAFASRSDEPVAGGWNTFQAVSVWGFRVLDAGYTTLTLGAGLAVGDFGLETADGGVWPVLPVPFVQLSHESPSLSLSFDFITGPNLSVVVAPERRLHLLAEARMDQFRDLQDLLFEVAVAYGVWSAGVSNGAFSYDPAGYTGTFDNEPFDIGTYAVFGRVDLSVVKVTAGYACAPWERHGDELTRHGGGGGGVILGVEALVPLGGSDR